MESHWWVPRLGRWALASLSFVLACPGGVEAVELGRVVPMPGWGGGGFVTFDGRLAFSQGQDPLGLYVQAFRPEAAERDASGYPMLVDGVFSGRHLVDTPDPTHYYNSLATCSEDPSRTPYRCTVDGQPSEAGTYECYDLYIFHNSPSDTDGDGEPDGPDHLLLQRLHVLVVVKNPLSPRANVERVDLLEDDVPLDSRIQEWDVTMTRDGRLLVFGAGEVKYSLLSESAPACAAEGWSAPRSLAEMHDDPAAARYPLAHQPLTDASGLPLRSVEGAYSWVFPDGDNVMMQAYRPRCQEPGSYSWRTAASVIGRSTRWTMQNADGDLNSVRGSDPDADPCHLVFFLSSPALFALPGIPATPGAEVWALFVGTGLYTELALDDSLDPDSLAHYHMNELVRDGEYHLDYIADASGNLHTAHRGSGALVHEFNLGPLGRALYLDGSGDGVVAEERTVTLGRGTQVGVGSAPSPGSDRGMTVGLWAQPHDSPSCEAPLARMEDAFSIGLDPDRKIHAVVAPATGERWESGPVGPPLPIGRHTPVMVAYDAVTGAIELRMLGELVATGMAGPGPLPSSAPLEIGGAGTCGEGMTGLVDEVMVLGRVASAEEACMRAGREPACEGSAPVVGFDLGDELPRITIADADGADDIDLQTLQVWLNGLLFEPVDRTGQPVVEGLVAPLPDGTGFLLDGNGIPIPQIEPGYRALRVTVADAQGNVTSNGMSLETPWVSTDLEPLDLVDGLPDDPIEPPAETPDGGTEPPDAESSGCASAGRPVAWTQVWLLVAAVALALLARRGRWIAAATVALFACASDPVDQTLGRGEALFRNETFEGNGRTCATCHVPEEELTLAPVSAEARFERDPAEPLFRPVDSDDGAGGSYEILTGWGLTTVNLTLPPNVEIEGDPDTRVLRVFRSVPPLVNLAETAPLQWDGRIETLEEQVWSALRDHFQMQRGPTADEIAEIVAFEVGSVLEAPAVLEGPAERGAVLFAGNARCAECHAGPLLHRREGPLAESFVNTKVAERNIPGLPVLRLVFDTGDRRITVETPDPGRAATTGDPADVAKMEIPSLLGIGRTAPYFHDNSAATLDDVLDHYDGFLEGGLRLSDAERADLVGYLEVL
ncbi:MAG: hypothetical protein HYY06_10590 [Deltaproteobacteria bacterium]|nr:hypothetical protein [Deltaproteobacteria bacterium]